MISLQLYIYWMQKRAHERCELTDLIREIKKIINEPLPGIRHSRLNNITQQRFKNNI